MVNMMSMYVSVGFCAFIVLLFLCINGLFKLSLYLIKKLLINPIIYIISFFFLRCPMCKEVHHGTEIKYYTITNLCENTLCQHPYHGSNKCLVTKVATSYKSVQCIESSKKQTGTREEKHEEYVRKCVGTENVFDWKDVHYTDYESYTDYELRPVYSHDSINTTTECIPVIKSRSITKTRKEQYMKSVPKYENILEYKTIQVPIYEEFFEEKKFINEPVYTHELCNCESSIKDNTNFSCMHCKCYWCHINNEQRPLLG